MKMIFSSLILIISSIAYSSVPQTSLISQYNCNFSSGWVSGEDVEIDFTTKKHFYFKTSNGREPLKDANVFLYCHDAENLGYPDSALHRAINQQDVFYLWDDKDISFYDFDANGNEDINDRISKKMKSYSRLFQPFQWITNPENEKGKTIGYILTPLIKEDSTEIFCPKANKPKSKWERVILDEIKVPTMFLYLAKREVHKEEYLALDDYLLITESELMKIAFQTFQGDKVFFYWPINYEDPYVKDEDQFLYSISLDNVLKNSFDSFESGILGCIPKL